MTRSSLVLALGAVCDAAHVLQQPAAILAGSTLDRNIPDAAEGFAMEKLGNLGEPGGSLNLTLGAGGPGGCGGGSGDDDSGDDDGPHWCNVHWGATTHPLVKIHVPGGLRRGDAIVSAVQARVAVTNERSAIARLIPSKLDYASRCQLCMGSCITEAQTDELKVAVLYPTSLVGDEVCSDEKLASGDFRIRESGGQIPNLADLKLDGSILVKYGVVTPKGEKRVEGNYALKAKSRHSAPPPSLAASHVFEALGTAFVETLSQTVVQKNQQQAFKEAFAGSQVAEVKQRAFVSADLTVADAVGRNHLQLLSPSCAISSPSRSLCKVQLGSPIDLGINLNATGNFELGSKLKMKANLAIGGLMGSMLSSMLPPMEIELPVCGPPAQVIVSGQVVEVAPPACSEMGLIVQTFKPVRVTIPDFVNMDLPSVPGMPFVPKSLAEMMPAALNIDVEFVKPDKSPMLSAKLSVKVDAQQ